MQISISRRDFLKLATATGLSIGTSFIFGACEPIIDAIANRPARKSIANLSPTHSDIVTFKDAVAAMKALPSTDGRNWNRQAQIHFDHCPHNNWFFLPWHRAYLFYFEKICRELTGNDEFALPYWNWTANPQIPSHFWGSGSNPLFHPGRIATAGSTASTNFVGSTVLESILNETSFSLFASGAATTQRQQSTTGRLEATPHNYIHGFVGGEMSSYQSPRDPIFWTHHNMIDCCWVEWNVERNHANTNDTQWTNFTFAGNFFDSDGTPVDITVLTTLLMPLLSYRYEDSTKGTSAFSTPLSNDALRQFLEAGAPDNLEILQQFRLEEAVEVSIEQPATLVVEVEAEAMRNFVSNDKERLLLTIGDIHQPPLSDFFVRTFVNIPEATAETRTEDPHYAGSFAFFFDPEHEHEDDSKPDFIVDLTDTYRRLFEAGDIDISEPAVNLQLVAVPFPDGRELKSTSFVLEFIELAIALTPQDEVEQ